MFVFFVTYALIMSVSLRPTLHRSNIYKLPRNDKQTIISTLDLRENRTYYNLNYNVFF